MIIEPGEAKTVQIRKILHILILDNLLTNFVARNEHKVFLCTAKFVICAKKGLEFFFFLQLEVFEILHLFLHLKIKLNKK